MIATILIKSHECNEGRLLTLREAAGLLRIHPRTLQRRIRENFIEHVKVGGRTMLTEKAVQAYIDANTYQPKPNVGG